MAPTRVVSGYLREIWNEAVAFDGGSTTVITTSIRLVTHDLCRVHGLLILNGLVGNPAITAVPSVAGGFLAVTITNTSAVGNSAVYKLDVMLLHTIQHTLDLDPTAIGEIHPIVATALGGYATNLRVQDEGGTIYYRYIRPTGSDVTGDGSLANPWATLEYAVQQRGMVLYNAYWVYDMTGCTEAHADGLLLPPAFSNGPFTYDFSAWYVFTFDTNVVATPTVLTTITAGQVTGQTLDAVTGLLTVSTNLAMVPNAYRGKLLMGQNLFEFAMVSGNTATDFETTGTWPLTPPISICDPGATLHNSDAFSNNGALRARYLQCAVGACGIKFTNASGTGVGFQAAATQVVFLLFCDACSSQYSVSAMNMIGTTQHAFCYLHGGGVYCENSYVQFLDCYFNGTAFRSYGAGEGFNISYSILEGTGPIGANGGNNYIIAMDIVNTLIRNPVANAIYYYGGMRSHLQNLKIGGATTAVVCDGPGIITLDNVQNIAGTPNTQYGLIVLNGCQVQRLNASLISGAGGAYKVGNNPAVANWGMFAGNEVDATSFARLFT